MGIFSWLKWCGAGVIAGLFPLWWWCSAKVYDATKNHRMKVPDWLLVLAKNSPGPGLFDILLPYRRYYVTIYKTLTTIYLASTLVFVQFYAWKNYVNGDFIYFLDLETGFLLFLLLTVILPSVILNRYLRKIGRDN
jgi:hypothetical protein